MSRAALVRLAIIIGVLIAWEALRRFDLVNAIILASPSEMWRAAEVAGGQFLEAFQITLAEILIAIVITWALGVGIGLVGGASARVGNAMGPILSSLFAIPLVVWYPLFMVWVGIGPASKILFGVVSGFLPIALNTMAGVRLLDRRYITLGRAMGASPRQIWIKMLVPLALPSVISGLRIGTALVVIGVVVTEMLASLGGIGFWISYHRTLFNTGHVYLGMLLALACALLVNWGLTRLEHRFGEWREIERSQT